MDHASDWASGDHLRGDDFSDTQIAEWFADEQRGYFDLTNGKAQSRPEYDALYELTLFRYVRDTTHKMVVAIGSAGGQDIRLIASNTHKFIIIEPTREFWRERIGGTPAEYRTPSLRGRVDVPDASVDMVVALNVLHHIPNVSDVLREIHRILRPGGRLLLKEPITTMGEWTPPRHGLTKNERGLPEKWLLRRLPDLGFTIERATPCYFPPWVRVMDAIGVLPHQHFLTMHIDLLLSRLTRWNARYYRPSFFRKFAPAALAIVARK